MKTLAQMRNGVLKKLNKKRKLEFSSAEASPVQKRKAESTSENFNSKDLPGGIDSSKKQNCEGSHGDQSLCLSTKGKKGGGGSQTVCLKKVRKQKKKKDKVVVDDAAQLQRRVRYMLVKMKLEQNLIDAYSGEGWKGQSREKIRPEKELQRAKSQILKCKLGIRDTVYQLELLGSVGQIDLSLISPDGSVHHDHIFCKKCKTNEVSEDNDIILCDGTCNCAFHQKCIDPPLATIDIPPEDEGWLCKYCDCKMEILEATNAHLGTDFSADCTWQDIFKEEALLSDAGTRDFNPEEEWPDDESDDNDYDPDRDENDSSKRYSMTENDLLEETSTSSSCCSLESEVISESGLSPGRPGDPSNVVSLYQNCVTESDDHDITSGPRKRGAVDYRMLYDEMFGKDTATADLFSEDEDWDPSKRRRRDKENDVASTLMTLCEGYVKHSNLQTVEVVNSHIPDLKARKPPSRIPCDVVQILRQAFSENELPSRDVKRKISKLVGLEYVKVNKWFKNARYMARKNKKRERTSANSPENFDSAVDEATEVVIPKCSSKPIVDEATEVVIPKCSSKHISVDEKIRLKKVSWKPNLTTLISPTKEQNLKNTSFGYTKADVELSEDMSLKKHLLYLKAKSKQKRRISHEAERRQGQNVERQMERLCRIEAKVWKLKQALSTIQKGVGNEPEDLHSHKQKIVYVPVAELKEKIMTIQICQS